MFTSEFNNVTGKELMRPEFKSTKTGEPLSEVIGIMRQTGIQEIPVLNKSQLAGMISYDLLVHRENIPASTKVDSIMRMPPQVKETDPMTKIAEMLMSHDYRSIPVVHKDKVQGMIDRMDIIGQLKNVKELSKLIAADIMTPEPLCVKTTDDIKHALGRMQTLDIRSIPVEDDRGQIVGVLAMKDIVEHIDYPSTTKHIGKQDRIGEKKQYHILAESIMNQPPIVLTPETGLPKIAQTMVDNKISLIPIVKENKLKGVISAIDLLELVARYREREMALVQISGLTDAEERDLLDDIYFQINKVLTKLSNLGMVRTLTVHVAQHHHTDRQNNFTLHGRLNFHDRMFFAKSDDYDLMVGLDDLLESLERQVHDYHDRRLELRRKRQRAGENNNSDVVRPDIKYRSS